MKLFGILMIVFGIASYVFLKKRDKIFIWKSIKGFFVSVFVVGGIFLFSLSRFFSIRINHLEYATPKNAPWEAKMTAQEAKLKNKNTENEHKILMDSLNLNKTDRTLFIDTNDNISVLSDISTEFALIGTSLVKQNSTEDDLTQKDAQIILQYIQKVKKPLEESSTYLKKHYENSNLSSRASYVVKSRSELEDILITGIKDDSYDEFVEVMVNDYQAYANESFAYFIDGSAKDEMYDYFDMVAEK